MMRPFDVDEFQQLLRTKWLGRHFVYMEHVDSTNDVAKQIAIEGAPNGALVLAEAQSAGRGRFGRSWFSPKLTGIYASFIVRPPFLPRELLILTIATAVGVCEGLRESTSLPVMVKWVNDLVLGGKKVGGILTEARASQSGVEFAIVGIGINVNTEAEHFPSELRCVAISLKEFSGKQFRRERLLASMLAHLERVYEALLSNGFEKLRERYCQLHFAQGKLVEVTTGSGKLVGVVKGLDGRGALMLQLKGGVETAIISGTVRLLE
jgi:BirA family biotin operon repressor/biotin-[acetyl-CoA-carboxylase] ligase